MSAWIKIEHTTPDKPEVIRMAAQLRIDPDAVVGKLLRVWIWADQNSIDGGGVAITDAFLDRLTHQRHFARAMRAVGWLTGEDGALTFPGFDRHNGVTAKARAESNRRMTKSRQNRNTGCADVAEKAQQKPQPEKRREEKKDNPGEEGSQGSAAARPRGAPVSPPALDTVKQWADAVMAPPECAEVFWNDHEARGWSDKSGQAVLNARAAFNAFATRWKSQAAAIASRSAGGPSKPPVTLSTPPKNGW